VGQVRFGPSGLLLSLSLSCCLASKAQTSAWGKSASGGGKKHSKAKRRIELRPQRT